MSPVAHGIDAERELRTVLTLSAVEGSAPGPDRSSTHRLAGAIAAHLSPRAGGSLADWDSVDALQSRAAFVVQAIDAAFGCPMCLSDLTGLPVMDVLCETELAGQWGDR